MSKKIALIDGYGFVFRAYHSLPPLTRSDGTPVGAVYGFTNMLIKLLAGLDVSHVAIAFDAGSKTFRNDIYPEYKANRPPCPEDLKPQFPIVRQAAESLNLAILEKTGFEADDIIATIAKKSASEGHEVLIVSSDKDLMQLVDDKISMYDAMKNRIIREKEVEEKFQVKPNKVLDVLSLMGDASDNVPGIRGIGPKTAAELIAKYGDLETLLENAEEIPQKKRREYIMNGKKEALLSRTLITLKEDVELGVTTEDFKIKALEPDKLISFLEEQGFRSLVSRVQKEFGIKTTNALEIKTKTKTSFENIKKTEISSEEICEVIYKKALEKGNITIDFHKKDFLTFASCKDDGNITEVFYIETASQQENTQDLFAAPEKEQKNQDFFWNFLTKLIEETSIKKIFFNAKEFFRIYKILPQSLDFCDVSLVNHLINSSIKSDLRELVDMNLDEDIESEEFNDIFNDLNKKREPKLFEDENKKINFLTLRNFAIFKLYNVLYPKIFDLNLNQAYFTFELPLLKVLAEIENNGIKVDTKKLHELSEELGVKINKLTKEIHDLASEEFNIASPKQLGEILFNKLELESSKKSKKTGALSTSSSVLEELEEQGSKIASKVLEFRRLSKLKNTYTDALPKEINPKTNRIHTYLSSTSTITGRLSSSNPNLQNIPIRTKEGRKIRECFISEKDNFLISADYSQIELRVIAHVAKIDNLIQAFKEDKDIHTITAAQVLKIKEDEVDKDSRSKAKAINFGIIYGISSFGLAKQLKISRKEASDYIKSYLEAYPGIEEYMNQYKEFAKKHGYIETISKRKCFIRDINHKNHMVKQEAQRLAINAPIQGSAADIIKIAMINLSKKLKEENLNSKIILQIHDELIIETPENEIDKVKDLLKKEMENAIIIDTPLKVDIELAKNWCYTILT